MEATYFFPWKNHYILHLLLSISFFLRSRNLCRIFKSTLPWLPTFWHAFSLMCVQTSPSTIRKACCIRPIKIFTEISIIVSSYLTMVTINILEKTGIKLSVYLPHKIWRYFHPVFCFFLDFVFLVHIGCAPVQMGYLSRNEILEIHKDNPHGLTLHHCCPLLILVIGWSCSLTGANSMTLAPCKEPFTESRS